jgi:hypothetical protein
VNLVSSPPRALLSDPKPALHGLGPASEKRPSTLAAKRRPRKLLLRLLHRGLKRASRSSDRKGMLIFNTFIYGLPMNPQASMHSASRYPFSLTCKEPCARERVPKGGQAPKSFVWEDLSRNVKAVRPKDNNTSAGAASNPTSLSATDLGCDVAHQFPMPDPTEPQEVSPQSPNSFRLGAHGGP